MQIFNRFAGKRQATSQANPIEVRDRVQAIRNRVGYRDVKLGDLFTIAGESERPRRQEPPVVVTADEPARLLPSQVPSLLTKHHLFEG